MTQSLRGSAQKIQDVLSEFNIEGKVVELAASARSAAEAAAAIGCTVEQIAKSLIFMTGDTAEPILVIASGTNRVNENKLSELVSHPVQKANAAFVLENTGFAIGGIPPAGHKKKIMTLIDEDLLKFDKIWAAAGTPHAVFCLTPEELLKLTSGKVVNVT